MNKPVPDPPYNTHPFSEAAIVEDLLKDSAAAQRALDHYLAPPAQESKPRKPGSLFIIAPGVDTESLLAHACETLASVSVMASSLAFELESTQRSSVLAIQQMVALAELTVNRALDNVDPA